MLKVCFVYDPEPNQKFIDILSKMTPGRSGRWKDMVAVPNEKDADYYVVIDDTSKKLNPKKTIYISAHPYMDGYNGYSDLSKKDCLMTIDLKNEPGFGEWWIKYDYDYLAQLKPMQKTNDVCYIVTNASGGWGRDRRKDFARCLESKYPEVNIYGRIIKEGVGKGELGQNTPEGYWFGKEEVLANHRYSIEVDVGLTKHYFSERVFDSLLMWCMPLYWGSTNIEQYLPEKCFRYINIFGEGEDIMRIVNTDFREQNLSAIAKARDLLLNKYQIWPRIYDVIKSL